MSTEPIRMPARTIESLEYRLQMAENRIRKLEGMVYSRPATKIVSMEILQKVIEDKFNLGSEALQTPNRSTYITRPRQLFSHLAGQMGHHNAAIARYLGQDHSSVVHSIKAIEIRLREDQLTRTTYQQIVEKITYLKTMGEIA